MVSKSYSVETPNWGDWSKGSHEVDFSREVYRRQSIPPRENEIKIELAGKEAGADPKYVFRFTASEVMDKSKKGFRENLFFNLNLVQENVGAVDVFPSDASLSEYLKTIYVDWEILPPGQREKNISRILANLGRVTPEVRAKIIDRYDFFEKLKPQALIQGHGGFKRYFGGKFADKLVVFENVEYGNALYCMFTDWGEQSKKTKQELLASGREGKDFVRIPHVRAWKSKVRKLVKSFLQKAPTMRRQRR